MIELIGEKLRQYDLGRKVKLIPRKGATIESVSFIRGGIVKYTPVKKDGAVFTADIPNTMLKHYGTLVVKVEGLDDHGYEVDEKRNFNVARGMRPDGYECEEVPCVGMVAPPDLAQNDHTAPDYVKNRTHYEETTVKTTEYLLQFRRIGAVGLDDESLCNALMNNPSGVVVEFLNTRWLVGEMEETTTAYKWNVTDETGEQLGLNTFLINKGTITVALMGNAITADSIVKVIATTEEKVVHKLDMKYLPIDEIKAALGL